MDSITAEKKAEVAAEPVKADGGAELTEEKLGEAWRKLSELYAAKPRLAAAISSGKVEIDASEGKLFYGLGSKHPMTLDEIGEQFDLSRERVRQIKEKAIRRLRHNAKCKVLQSYL